MMVEVRSGGGCRSRMRDMSGHHRDASPAGDSLPVFAAIGAVIVLRGVLTVTPIHSAVLTGYRKLSCDR